MTEQGTKECSFCHRRRVNPRDWKNEEENSHCFTCQSFIEASRGLRTALSHQLASIGVQGEVSLMIKYPEKGGETYQEMIIK